MHRMLLRGFNRSDVESGSGRLFPVINSITSSYLERISNNTHSPYNNTTMSFPVPDHKLPHVNSTLYDDYVRYWINSKYSNHNNNNHTNDNFYYQHIFNLSLVLIFLLQALLVWTFLCKKRRSGDEDNDNDLNLELGNIPDVAIFVQQQQDQQNQPIGGQAQPLVHGQGQGQPVLVITRPAPAA